MPARPNEVELLLRPAKHCFHVSDQQAVVYVRQDHHLSGFNSGCRHRRRRLGSSL